MEEIKKTMNALLKRIQEKCKAPNSNGSEKDIFFLAAALKEIDSVRATLPREFLDS